MVDLGFLFVFVFFPLYIFSLFLYRLHKRTLRKKSALGVERVGPRKRPNYRLRLLIAATLLFATVLGAIVLTPSGITGDFLYWVGLGVSSVYVSLIMQLEDIPSQREIIGNKSWLIAASPFLVGAALTFIPMTRFVGIGFITGNFSGMALGMVVTSVTSLETKCPLCEEYRLFIRYKGARYCNACGNLLPGTRVPGPIIPARTVANAGVFDVAEDQPPSLAVKTKRCGACRSELVLQHSDISGKYANVQVEFHMLPYVGCPNGHERQYAFEDFGYFLITDIHHAIPISQTEGTSQNPRCVKCDELLDRKESQRVKFTIEFHWRNWDIFDATVILPSVQCKSCLGYQRMKSKQLDSNVSDAVLDAFSSLSLSRS